jgi:hypothetical protein
MAYTMLMKQMILQMSVWFIYYFFVSLLETEYTLHAYSPKEKYIQAMPYLLLLLSLSTRTTTAISGLVSRRNRWQSGTTGCRTEDLPSVAQICHLPAIMQGAEKQDFCFICTTHIFHVL